MAVKLPDTLVPMADFPSAFAKDVQFTDGESLKDKLDEGKLWSSSSGTGLTEEQANNIEKIPSIEGIVTSNSQAIENKADKDHEHTEYLKEIPDEYVTDTELSTELDKKVDKEVGKGLSTNDLTNELITKINSSATEAFVTNAIANAQLDGGEVDLSGYATVDALNLKADLTHTHDQYLTEVPDEYVTETELTAKGYLTEHQDISGLQPKTDDSLTTTDKTVIGAINELKTNINNINTGGGSSFSGSYNDLTDKPTIPTKTSQLNNDSGFLDSTNVIIVNKGNANTSVDLDNDIPIGNNAILLTGTVAQSSYDNELVYINKRSSTSIMIYNMRGNKLFVMKSGSSWNQVENVNFIYPTDTLSSLTTTAKTVPGAIDELRRGLNGIKVPTKTSDLTNDSGYLTSHQDISNLQPKTDNSLATSDKTVVGAINELKTNINNINTGGGSSFSGSYNDLTDKPIIPTKTSDLNNDSGFIGYPDVIVINKGSMDAEVDLDSDIPLGRNTILLTGRVVSNTYNCELVSVYRDRESSDSFTIHTMRGDKVVVSKLSGNWSITSSTSFIYRDKANSLYQKITDNTLTTTAKTVPTAINELKSRLDGINDSGYLSTEDITTTINSTSTDTQVPSAKAVYDGLENINDFSVQVIKEKLNLNNITETGIYFFSRTYTPVNIPVGASGWLLVMKGSYSDIAKQVWYALDAVNSNSCNTFERYTVGDTWSEWTKFLTETELNAKGYLTSHQDISGLQTKTDNNLTTTTKEVVGAINEVKDMADLILDTEVRIDKTYSSSKIYSAIQDAIDSSKSFTLDDIGKMSGASYKVVTSTAEMTDEKIIYLLENDTTYDMYIVETAGTATKIGDTGIDLSSYLKVTDAESAYLKKTVATSTYVAQTSFNNHITDTVAHLTQFEKNKLLTTDNITSTINNSSDNTQVPSAKAVYDGL